MIGGGCGSSWGCYVAYPSFLKKKEKARCCIHHSTLHHCYIINAPLQKARKERTALCFASRRHRYLLLKGEKTHRPGRYGRKGKERRGMVRRYAMPCTPCLCLDPTVRSYDANTILNQKAKKKKKKGKERERNSTPLPHHTISPTTPRSFPFFPLA